MEAATPLRQPRIVLLANAILVDGLLVDDPTVLALARQRAEAGEDLAKVVSDAMEIGARVLDREQTGANADFVKAEFEKASREVEHAFTERARATGDLLTAAFERHFSDDSSGAVQHKVRQVVAEVTARMREDLVRQFSAADASNPLAQFQRGVLIAMKQGAEQQDANLGRLNERIAAMQVEIQKLHSEREKQLELAAEVDRGTAKGRTFEDAVADALDGIALAQGDLAQAVGDHVGTTRKTGDVVVDVEAARGPSRGRIVFEAKTARLSGPKAVEELDRAKSERGADYAVLVVPNEDKVPARMQQLREFNGDKLIVTFDPEDGSTLCLETAYCLARARVVMARGEAEGVDVAAVRDLVERATGSLTETLKVKQQLTGATTSIEKARELVEHLAAQVRGYLAQIEGLLDAAGDA
jgi:hypothetical protein